MLTQTDALGRVTHSWYDQLGEETSVTDPLGNYVVHVRRAGNKLTETDLASGNVTHYGYDHLSQLISVTAPASGTQLTTYDANGNVLTQTDGLGHVTSYTYDRLNRLTGVVGIRWEGYVVHVRCGWKPVDGAVAGEHGDDDV